MFLHSIKHFDGGRETVEGYYDAFRNGMVESLPTLPDGSIMSPAQYVDAMGRLQEFSAHPEAVKLMYQELNCASFHPSDEQKQIIADALKDISYEHGKMRVAIMNDCGELEIKEVSRWGQYIGKQKMVEAVVDGRKELIPLRTANRTYNIGATVDCADGKVNIHGRVKYASLPCDKQFAEVVPPAPKKVAPPVEIIPEIECPDIPAADMPENTSGYQTRGTYYPPIDRYTDYDSAVQHITAKSFSENTVMQTIKSNYAAASQAEGFSLKKFIKACGGELLNDNVDGNITFNINHGTVIDTQQGLLDADQGANIEISMKHEDFMRFAETGELPSTTRAVPLTDENYKAILMDEKFAYKGDKNDRSNFLTSVEGAEYFSMPKPVDFNGEVSQLSIENGGKLASVTMNTSSGQVDVYVNTETGDITAKLGDKSVRFSPETQEKAAKALVERLSSRYDVADLSLSAPEGTLAKKAEMAMLGQSYVPSNDQIAQNVCAVGKVNISPSWLSKELEV